MSSSCTRPSRRCLCSAPPSSSRRWSGAEMLDRLADHLFEGLDPAAILHDAITQELRVDEDGARLKLALPFANKGDISLKKIGLELIVGVDGQKRTIMLPPALAAFRPTAATFEDGRAGGAIRWIARPTVNEDPQAGASRSGDDVLSRLEQRLDRASEAAERLISEAAAAAVRKPPPAGWQQPEPEPGERAGADAGRDRASPAGDPCPARSDPGRPPTPARGGPARGLAGAPGPDRLVSRAQPASKPGPVRGSGHSDPVGRSGTRPSKDGFAD